MTNMDAFVHRITPVDRHYFFGFHDTICTSFDDRYLLTLGVDEMNHPPLPNQKATCTVIDLQNENSARHLFETTAFNYPQGARQHWLNGAHQFIVNAKLGDHFGSVLVDVQDGSVLNKYDFTIYTLAGNNKEAYTLNFNRVHRLGGYGYVGGEDLTRNEAIPELDGIYKCQLDSGTSELLVSIKDVAQVGQTLGSTGYHHYITHLALSPDASTLAFLHRYRLADGGETTRLMAVKKDGSNIQCIAKGFLSHFCWLGNDRLMIFGRPYSDTEQMRERGGKWISAFKQQLQFLKPLVKKLLGNPGQNNKFRVFDLAGNQLEIMAPDLMDEDGHPMLNPRYDFMLSNDTYPDQRGFRELYLYHTQEKRKISLGRFREMAASIDFSHQSAFNQGIDEAIFRHFDPKKYAHYRSGIHCDLHPRWSHQGKLLCFDSNHEGKRQVYQVDISTIIESK